MISMSALSPFRNQIALFSFSLDWACSQEPFDAAIQVTGHIEVASDVTVGCLPRYRTAALRPITAQDVAAAEMNWSRPCGKP